ncbi:MAG: exodeoxyribonuclease III [Myxococcales bacterium]|nr:exodeoxyribonuclease III [Myxococcales bacterium]
MKIVSWNVNSIRARHDRFLNWLQANEPDVVCLQELKCQEDDFPWDEISSLGYTASVLGQKTYNGVAILSFADQTNVAYGMDDGVDDAQARFVAATIEGVRVIDVYVPNGGTMGSDKWAYKLEWYGRLRRWLDAKADPKAPLVLCGDFNVAPTDLDVARPKEWADGVLCAPAARAALANVADFGLIDTFRQHEPGAGHYSWWDYRRRGLAANNGLRIDFILATEPLAARCKAAGIDRDEREETPGEPKPSDHAPIWAEFD